MERWQGTAGDGDGCTVRVGGARGAQGDQGRTRREQHGQGSLVPPSSGALPCCGALPCRGALPCWGALPCRSAVLCSSALLSCDALLPHGTVLCLSAVLSCSTAELWLSHGWCLGKAQKSCPRLSPHRTRGLFGADSQTGLSAPPHAPESQWAATSLVWVMQGAWH